MDQWAAAYYAAPATGSSPEGVYDPLATGIPLASECVSTFFDISLFGPAPGVANDFGMRAVRDFKFTTGQAVLRLRHDDGVRVYLNGLLIHEQWTNHSSGEVEIPMFAAADDWHRITIEYFDHEFLASLWAVFEDGSTFLPGPWAPTDCPAKDPWRYRLYDPVPYNLFAGTYGDIDITTLDTTGCERGPEFLNGRNVRGGDVLSAQIERDVVFAGGMTTFLAEVDNGMRIYIDGRKIMDDWTLNAGVRVLTTNTPVGSHRLMIEFRNNSGSHNLKLEMKP